MPSSNSNNNNNISSSSGKSNNSSNSYDDEGVPTARRTSRNTAAFNALADRFTAEYATQRAALERCMQRRVNDDVNFVCQAEKSAYMLGVALLFCRGEYDAGVRCQRAAGAQWATDCFKENVAFGKCADTTLKQLYVYNLEHDKKNPAAN